MDKHTHIILYLSALLGVVISVKNASSLETGILDSVLDTFKNPIFMMIVYMHSINALSRKSLINPYLFEIIRLKDRKKYYYHRWKLNVMRCIFYTIWLFCVVTLLSIAILFGKSQFLIGSEIDYLSSNTLMNLSYNFIGLFIRYLALAICLITLSLQIVMTNNSAKKIYDFIPFFFAMILEIPAFTLPLNVREKSILLLYNHDYLKYFKVDSNYLLFLLQTHWHYVILILISHFVSVDFLIAKEEIDV